MIGISNEIVKNAASWAQFTVDDLLPHSPGVERTKLIWYLSKLCKQGKIHRIGRGLYTAQKKQTFNVVVTEQARKLYNELKTAFPLADFCVYHGSTFIPLLHDLAFNNCIYVETNRDATESVFNHLRNSMNDHLFLAPNLDAMYRYVDVRQHNVIVKPMVTESPVALDKGMPIPTLEKLLVDIRVDKDFHYMQGYEGFLIFRTAVTDFIVNQNKLLRYAERRGIKEEVKKDLEEIS